ncbi:MAG: HlyD family type I secretion periplasmic adaptor subunit [Hyphomicrobiaceae bacterium]
MKKLERSALESPWSTFFKVIRGNRSGDVTTDQHDKQLRRRALVGCAVVGLLVLGGGGWAATAKLASAVIAPGTVVVDSNSKKVQHPTGGIVGEIKVKNGDKVAPGQLVVRLDDTQVKATLGVVLSQLVQFRGRQARLEAERDSRDKIKFPDGFESEGAAAREVADGELRLFEARRKSSAGQREQLREKIRQTNEEITGLKAQLDAKQKEAGFAKRELGRVDGLFQKNLVNETRHLAMLRDVTRIEGEVGGLISSIARAKAQISQTELQIIQVDQDIRTESQKELREVEARIAELFERRVAAEDQLRRVDITAPIGGIVHELGVHTVGGVIQAGEVMMLIVPVSEILTVEARIPPQERDQVAIGMPARLRFSAFNQRTTPEVGGLVTGISADLSKEQATGATYYVVRIRISETAREQLAGLSVVPGMPVEAFIEAGERTAMTYITKPFTDNLRRIFTER